MRQPLPICAHDSVLGREVCVVGLCKFVAFVYSTGLYIFTELVHHSLLIMILVGGIFFNFLLCTFKATNLTGNSNLLILIS
jgi:hypothetical protein